MTGAQRQPVRLTARKIRHLTAEALGQKLPDVATGQSLDELTLLDVDDPILVLAKDLLEHYGGLIFVGPPGTSKSWYAARLGMTLVNGDKSRLRFVQFHPSYQYEDFVEGYVPEDGGFVLRDKHFLEMCGKARDGTGEPAVLVIDELSRGDPGRVFGEALTYLEKSKRGFKFHIASGKQVDVPEELVVLATMNPQDRGVDEVDAALDRRFAKIAMEPDAAVLRQFLTDAGMDEALKSRVVVFFKKVNRLSKTNPLAALGQTYFVDVSDQAGLRRVWDHQLRFHFDKAYRLDPKTRSEIDRWWDQVLGTGSLATAPAGASSEGNGPEVAT